MTSVFDGMTTPEVVRFAIVLYLIGLFAFGMTYAVIVLQRMAQGGG